MRFRLSAVASLSDREQLHTLLQVTAPREWLVLTAVFAVVAAVVAWALFGTVERAVHAECVIIRPGIRYTVVSGVAGTVTEVLARPGRLVGAGDALARVRQPTVERELRIAEARLERAELDFAAAGGREAPAALVAARDAAAELRAAVDAGGLVATSWAGEIEVFGPVVGDALTADSVVAQIRTGPDGPLEALAFLPAPAGVATGQEARLRSAAGRAGAFAARVGGVGDPAPAAPPWVVSLGVGSVPPAGPGRLVRLLVDPAPAALAPGPCSVRIVTARHAPVLLVVPGGAD